MATKHSQLYKVEQFLQEDEYIFVNRAAENFHLPLHNHDFIELAYVAEGKGFHHIGETVVSVHKGLLFILPPGISHVFRPSTPSQTSPPLIVYNCVFRSSLLIILRDWIGGAPPIADLLEQQLTHPAAFQPLFDDEGLIDALFCSLLREYNNQQIGSDACLRSLLVQLLVSIHRLLQHASKPSIKPVSVQHILIYMEQHAHENLTVGQLAERCQWSERHFGRVFKAHTGQSFLRYLQQLRIKKSCVLLRSSQQKIGSIAEEVGYKNIDAFLTHFKRIVGMTPRDYRRIVQNRHVPDISAVAFDGQ
ncbi:AraC family L-rhamnose operon transcriptional activator RhaR [Paenibacillus endophyticus]|uniref:AraC family L-rhamnose operon transcriptional activator RhaR n=1 Tax=Paenibacillus endophyticus TaxID=1294268 RepID=A0A7W5GB42_9BACL|nr:AraC family transcriptional regulator [Paenibacillus endophyticus]MBB3153401.1 AraC family L-rhamnose operon transcriptional activator RhaR [Paenibacillus endophyticus]